MSHTHIAALPAPYQLPCRLSPSGGVVVPIPAFPLAGKVLVACAKARSPKEKKTSRSKQRRSKSKRAPRAEDVSFATVWS